MNFGRGKEATAYTYITREALSQLDERAARVGCSRAALIRRCITLGLRLDDSELGGGCRGPSSARHDHRTRALG